MKHGSVVGVDASVCRLATVADQNGEVIERVENPRALDRSLARFRRLHRARSRCTPGSARYRRITDAISRLDAHIANQRADAMHILTTRLAKTNGTVEVKSPNVSGLLTQKHSPGARRRSPDLADASMSEIRRQLTYKSSWYGSELVEADPLFPSSRFCHVWGEENNPGWEKTSRCVGCGNWQHRNDNAAINLAHYSEGDVGTVGAPDESGAERKIRHRWTAGCETTKACSGLPGETRPVYVNPMTGTG